MAARLILYCRFYIAIILYCPLLLIWSAVARRIGAFLYILILIIIKCIY